MNRRQVLGLLGLSALGTGFYAACGGGQAPFGRGSGESGLPLRALPVLPVRRPEPGLALAELVASPVAGGLAYNGQRPAPLLRVRENEHLHLTFSNDLAPATGSRTGARTDDHAHHTEIGPNDTNLHLHDPLIAPATDAPMTVLAPGESRRIELDLTGSGGTHWYHPHPHGLVTRQQRAGLAGAMVVEQPLDAELGEWEDHVLLLRDDLRVNGQRQPVLHAGSTGVRLRLLNASVSRDYRLNLGTQPLYLIATDGHFLERPVELPTLTLAPGNRADVLVRLEGSGPVALRHDNRPLLTLQGRAGRRPPRLPGFLEHVEHLDPARAVLTRQLKFGGEAVNRRPFDHGRVDVRARLNTLEVWDLDLRVHPFHLHSYPVQILSRDGRPEPFRAWRDVVYAHEFGDSAQVRIAVPFRRYAGRTVFHCHITQHEDAGMMGVLEVRG